MWTAGNQPPFDAPVGFKYHAKQFRVMLNGVKHLAFHTKRVH
jgi:hypothetical protein